MDNRAQLREQMSMLFDVPLDELRDDMVMNKDVYASSLHYFGLISEIEELTGKSIDYEVIKTCPTVGDILALLD